MCPLLQNSSSSSRKSQVSSRISSSNSSSGSAWTASPGLGSGQHGCAEQHRVRPEGCHKAGIADSWGSEGDAAHIGSGPLNRRPGGCQSGHRPPNAEPYCGNAPGRGASCIRHKEHETVVPYRYLRLENKGLCKVLRPDCKLCQRVLAILLFAVCLWRPVI